MHPSLLSLMELRNFGEKKAGDGQKNLKELFKSKVFMKEVSFLEIVLETPVMTY